MMVNSEDEAADTKNEHHVDVIDKSGGKGDEHEDVKEKEEELPLEPPVVEVIKKSKRVAALDAFRGLTIVIMILVDDAGSAYERMDHSPWNGCTLADFVMPFFLFIVGVAIAFAFKKVPKVSLAIRRIIIRCIKMIFWGILLQGGYSHAPNNLTYGVDMKKIRWSGILQRIALVYFVVATVEAVTIKVRPTLLPARRFAIFDAYRWQWLIGFAAFMIYMITTFSLYVPDWDYVFRSPGDANDGKTFTVKCGMRGHLGQACNAVGFVDREVLGINHIYRWPVWIRSKECTNSSPLTGPLRADAAAWCLAPFEPEGLLSSVSAIVSGTIGIHYGHVLIHFKGDRELAPLCLQTFTMGHKERLQHWMLMGVGLLILGIILHFTDAIPINKQLYSISYVFFTAGAAGIVFSVFYVLIDVWNLRLPFVFMEWIGMNAMLVFVLGAQAILGAFVNGWYYEKPENTLIQWILRHVFIDVWNSERLGTLLYVIFAEICFWGVLAGVLHKLGIYWKL